MKTILIQNGIVTDPKSRTKQLADMYIEDGIIKEIAEGIDRPADVVLDAEDCYVMPGFIDMHVHLETPD